MFKAIPLSAILLLGFGTAHAQDSTTTTSTNGSTTPVTTSTPSTTTDSTLMGTDTATTPNEVPTTPGGTMGTEVDSTTAPTTTPPTTIDVSTTPTTTTTGVTGTETNGVTTTGTTTTPTSPTSFTCLGLTPQWNLSISKDLITYSSSKSGSMKIKSVSPMIPVGDSSGTLQVYSARTEYGKPVTILVKKNNTGCTNGQPGQTYQYDAFVVFSNMVVTGCCNAR